MFIEVFDGAVFLEKGFCSLGPDAAYALDVVRVVPLETFHVSDLLRSESVFV